MNEQNIQESEQMITTEGQITPSCKGRMILLFNSTILQRDCHFVKEFFNFKRRPINNDQREFRGTRQQIKGIRQELDSRKMRNQDLMAPAPYHIPLRGSECQNKRAPALTENVFWSRVLDWGRETEMSRSTDKISKSLSE